MVLPSHFALRSDAFEVPVLDNACAGRGMQVADGLDAALPAQDGRRTADFAGRRGSFLGSGDERVDVGLRDGWDTDHIEAKPSGFLRDLRSDRLRATGYNGQLVRAA